MTNYLVMHNEIKQSEEGLSLIHGDLTLDNIHLSSQTKRITVIDWEMSGAGAKEEDLSSLVSSLISLKVLQLSTPGLNPSKFADELLKVHGRAVNFLDAYIEKVDETINYKLLDCLFKEKIRCRTILSLHMFGERSLQFRLLESVYKKLVVSGIVSVVDFSGKG